MAKEIRKKGRLPRRVLTAVAAVAGAALIAAGGTMAYADYREGRYVNVQDGYILKRLDAQDSYVVKLPACTRVGEASARSAARRVTLTYDHSEKGRKNNWDIYTDEAGYRYTYHEITGRMVSIEYYCNTAAPRTAAAYYPTGEEVRAFAEQYLSQLIPQFGLYGLASMKFTGSEPNDPNGNYLLYYGVKIGDYFTEDGISLEFTSTGELCYVNFPQTAVYEELTTGEKERLAERIPPRQELERYAREQMEEKYGEHLTSVQFDGMSLRKRDTGFCMEISVTAFTELPCYAEYLEYPLE
jgi:hypothetical protein